MTTPAIYALGTTTTAISFLVIGTALATIFHRSAPPPAARLGCRPGHGLTMRIVIVNPNTSSRDDRDDSRRRAPCGERHDRNRRGAASRQGRSRSRASTTAPSPYPASLRKFFAPRRPAAEAHVIACFDDTGLDAARSAVVAPVVGIGEAAFHVASLVSSRFTVITTLARSVPIIERNLANTGLATRCARVRATDIPVLALDDPQATHAPASPT